MFRLSHTIPSFIIATTITWVPQISFWIATAFESNTANIRRSEKTVSRATSAETGCDVAKGALTGPIGGIFGGLGGALGGGLGGPVAALAGGVAGGATGGAVSAAVTGGDVGMGALTGAIAGGIGWWVGWFNHEVLKDSLNDFSVSVIGGRLGGGARAELQGGDFWEGAAYGAAGAAAAHGLYTAIRAPWNKLSETIRQNGGADIDSATGEGLDLGV